MLITGLSTIGSVEIITNTNKWAVMRLILTFPNGLAGAGGGRQGPVYMLI